MAEKQFKTPNGNILTEGELKKEYGERFNSLIQDNTFTEVTEGGEGEVKKKELSTPSTTTGTQSVSQEPKTKGKPLSVGEKPKKTGASASSTGTTKGKLFGERPSTFTEQKVEEFKEVKKKEVTPKKPTKNKDISPSLITKPKTLNEALGTPKTIEESIGQAKFDFSSKIKVPMSSQKELVDNYQKNRAKNNEEGLASVVSKSSADFDDAVSGSGILNKTENFIRGSWNTAIAAASKLPLIGEEIASASDKAGILVDKNSVEKYFKQADDFFNKKGINASKQDRYNKAKELKIEEDKRNYIENQDSKFLEGIKNDEYLDPGTGKKTKVKDLLALNDYDKYKTLDKETVDLSNKVKFNDLELQSIYEDMQETKKVLNHQIIFGNFPAATDIYNKIKSKEGNKIFGGLNVLPEYNLNSSELSFIKYYDENKEQASKSPVNPNLNTTIDGLNKSLLNYSLKYDESLKQYYTSLEKYEKKYDEKADVYEDFDNSRRSYDNVFLDKGVLNAKETVNGVIKMVETLVDLSSEIKTKYDIPAPGLDKYLFNKVFEGYNYYDFKNQIDKEKELIREDVKKVTDINSFVNYFSDVSSTQLGQMSLPMMAGYGKVAMPLLRQSAVYFSSGFGNAVGEAENYEERLKRGETEAGEIGKVYSTWEKVLHGSLSGTADIIGNLPTAIRISKGLNNILQTPSTSSMFWESFAKKGIKYGKEVGVELIEDLGKDLGEETLSEWMQNASKVFVLKDPTAKLSDGTTDVLKDTTTFGVFMKVFPLFGKGIINRISNSNELKVIQEREKELGYWKNRVNEEGISEDTKKLYNDKALRIESELNSTYENARKRIAEKPFLLKEVEDVNSQIEEKIKEGYSIKDNKELTDSEKDTLLKEKELEYGKLKEKRENILSDKYDPVTYLPEVEATKLKAEAAEVIIQEQIDKGIERDKIQEPNPEVINKKAKEIYETRKTTNEEKLGGDTKTTTEVVAAQGENAAKSQEEINSIREDFDNNNLNAISINVSRDGFSGEFLDDYDYLAEGSEHIVYRSKDGKTVIKIGEPYGSNEGFMPRVEDALRINRIIGDGSLRLIGYYENNGIKNPVYSQNFVEGDVLSQEEVSNHLESKGFVSIGKDKFAIKIDGKIYEISDTSDNFIKDKDGNVFAVDAGIFELKESDLTNDQISKINNTTSEKTKQVEELRQQELVDFREQVENPESFITDGKIDAKKVSESDNAKAKEIYAKYDKLIKPLLTNIKTQEDAIQKQSTNEGVLQPGQSEMGLQEVEQGNTEQEITSKQGEEKVNTKISDPYTSSEVDRVKALPVESEDGATMNLDGSKYEDGGLVIPLASKNMNASELTPEAIQSFIDENAESVGADNVKVGIYKFPNSNQVSVDINIVADSSVREEAIAIGKELGQESLFDLDTFENVKTGSDGMNPKKLTPAEFKDIQKRLQPKSKGIEVSKDINQAKKQISNIADKKIAKSVLNGVRAISKILPNVKVILHDTDNSFRSVSGESKNQSSSGLYQNGTIHINLEKANRRTVAHEVFHAILLDRVKTDANAQAVTKKMIQAIASKIEGNPALKAKLEDFASMYDENIQNEEKLAEFIGILAANYDSLSGRAKEAIKAWLNSLAKMFGVEMFESNEVLDVLNTIAKKVATGKEINKSETKIFEGGKVVENPSASLREQKVGSFDVAYTEQDNIDNLIKKGLVSEPNDTSFMSGEDSAITSPDDMLVGTISIDGKQIFEGGGGVFFVTKYGDVWASGKEGTANTLARAINKSLENNKSGKGYLTLTKGSDSKLISSSSGVKSSLSVLESMLDNGLISLSDFRSAVSSSVKLFGGEISLKGSAKQLKQDIDAYFSNPKETTFQKRGDVLNKIIDIIAQSKNTKLNKDKIIEFLGGNVNKGIVSKVTSQNKSRNQSLSDLIAGIASEQLTKGLSVGDVYAVIEVSGEVIVKEDSHPSYPFHVVQKDGKKPILHLPKNRENGSKTITTSSGKPYSVGNVSIMSGKFNETSPRNQKTLPTKVSEKLTENKDGDFVFKHYSDQERDVIKRGQGNNAITSREEASALSAVGGLAMFYTMEGQKETGVGNVEHTVTIPKDKVYDIDSDPLGFEKEARKRFNEVRPGQAFTNNHRGAFITKIANDNGFDMAVTQWRGSELRAQTTNELKPSNDTTPFKERPLPTFEVGDKAIIDGKESIIESVEGQKIGYKSIDGTAQGVTINNERNRRSIIKIEPEVSSRKQKTEEEITRKKSVAAKKNVLAGKAGRLDDSGKANPLESRMLNITLINASVLKNAVSKDLYDRFVQIIQDLSVRRLTIKDLTKDFISNVNETYDSIISDYNAELQKIDDIQSKIDSDSTLTDSEQSYIDSNKKLFKAKVDEDASEEKKEKRRAKDEENRVKISNAVKAVSDYFESSDIKPSSMEFRILNALSSLTQEDIDNMDSSMLDNAVNALESASDGVMTSYAENLFVYKTSRNAYNAAKKSAESKKGGVYGSKVSGFIPEMRQRIKAFIAGNGKDTIKDRVESIALFAIDSALKRYSGNVLYENITSLLSKRVASHDEKMRKVNTNLKQVYDNILKDSKNVHISLMKIRYNQLQNMFNLNEEKNNTSGRYTARQFFDETLVGSNSKYGEDQKKLIKEFLKALDNNEFDVDDKGMIKMDKIEGAAYEAMNRELQDKSIDVYESSFFQNGNAAPLVEGYASVQPNTDSSQDDDFQAITSNFSTPSTKSGNLISKKGSLHPINLNPFSATISSINSTDIQFELRSEINGILNGLNTYMNELKQELKNKNLSDKETKTIERKAKETKEIYEAVKNASELLVSGNTLQSSGLDTLLDKASNIAYKIYLASGIRTAADFAGNVIAASIQDPTASVKGLKVANEISKLKGDIDDNMSTFLVNIQNPQITRVMETKRPSSVNEEFANRGVNTNFTTKNLPSKIESFINKVKIKSGFGKVTETTRSINEKLTSISDNLPYYHFSIGKFVNEFNKISNKELDVEAVINDPNYLIKNRDLITKAANKANYDVSELMGSKNTFENPIRVTRAKVGNVKGRNGLVRAIIISSNFLNTFNDRSIDTVSRSINKALSGEETWENVKKVVSQSVRATSYALMINSMMGVIASALMGEDDEEEKLKDSLDNLADNDKFIKSANDFFENKETTYKEKLAFVDEMLKDKDFKVIHDILKSYNNRIALGGHVSALAKSIEDKYDKETYESYLKRVDDKFENQSDAALVYINSLAYLHSKYGMSLYSDKEREDLIGKIEDKLEDMNFYMMDFTGPANALYAVDSDKVLDRSQRRGGPLDITLAERTLELMNSYRKDDIVDQMKTQGAKWLTQVAVGRANTFIKGGVGVGVEYFNKERVDNKFGKGYYNTYVDNLGTPSKVLSDKSLFGYVQQTINTSLSPTVATVTELLMKSVKNKEWQATAQILSIPGLPDLSRVQSKMRKDKIKEATGRQFQENMILDFSKKKFYKTKEEKEADEKAKMTYNSRLYQEKIDGKTRAVRKPKSELKFGGK